MSITTIIPIYNAELFLAEAIESVLSQTRHVDEILLVDDCSTDGSVAIARRYPQARILSTPRNSGPATARNLGIEAARGDLIAWLDADDFWEPNHCEVVCGLLDRFPDAAVAYSAVRFVGTRHGIWYSADCDLEPFDARRRCFEATCVPAMSAVTRRSAILDVGGFDSSIRIAPDFDLWLRMAESFLFVSTPQLTSNYRWHQNQISNNPFLQISSVYRSKSRFLERARGSRNAEQIAELELQIRRHWDRDLIEAWKVPDARLLKAILSLESLIPGETETGRWLRRWQWIPSPLLQIGIRIKSRMQTSSARSTAAS